MINYYCGQWLRRTPTLDCCVPGKSEAADLNPDSDTDSTEFPHQALWNKTSLQAIIMGLQKLWFTENNYT